MSVQITMTVTDNGSGIMAVKFDVKPDIAVTQREHEVAAQIVQAIQAYGAAKRQQTGIGGGIIANASPSARDRIGAAMLAKAEKELANGYTCPNCGAVSYNPSDKEHNYCAKCKQFNR